MDDGTSICVDFCTDILVEILQRLPANSRRRSRVVCRRWRESRDAVDERTATDLRSRAKTLLVYRGGRFVLDDSWRVKPVLFCRQEDLEVVGTCNGLICLCGNSKPGGAIVLINPANAQRLAVPPLLFADLIIGGRLRWHDAYGFAHNQSTGQYKVMHFPCSFDRIWEFHTVQVFTLGETSWRDVTTPAVGGSGVRCLRKAGIVSWVAVGTERIVSFDLDDECVTSVHPLPVPLPTRPGSSFHLAEVYGRLGVAIFHESAKLEKTDVWVLESARREQRWRRWYSVEVNMLPEHWITLPAQWITLPHFAHGQHVLAHWNGNLWRKAHTPTRPISQCNLGHGTYREKAGTTLSSAYIYKTPTTSNHQ